MGMPVAKKCELCDLPTQNYFENIAAYDNHIRAAHPTDPSKCLGDGWKCNTCALYFSSCADLTKHQTATNHR